ncbi:hypothetical protein GTW43_19245 [Streptomyces sp. SID5785]|uniref:hypothetical protein n=1 Tax=Streptomyces sp. SID5785 TaxID=2690309 RepID=UPI0013613742|nr:hypothetical protein [Streptomyces sp. SID5785]MZD07205.1 hypothetical protein [Streptomyces sp. SID5785]
MHPNQVEAPTARGGRGLERRGLLLGLAGGAVALTATTASAQEPGRSAARRHDAGQLVQAVAAPDGVRLSTGKVRAGVVTLRATTPDQKQQHPIGLLRLRPGLALGTFLTHYQQAATAADPAERRKALELIDAEAVYFGGPAVTYAGGALETTWVLSPGTYHVLDYTTATPDHAERVRTLTVTGTRPTGRPRVAPHIVSPYEDGERGTFLVDPTLPADGAFQVVNQTSQLNEVMFLRTTADATEASVTACMEALRKGEQPPTYPFEGVPTGLTPLQPGASAVFAHSLPPGRYLLTSFISNRQTLVKRAFEGMWQLVTLR